MACFLFLWRHLWLLFSLDSSNLLNKKSHNKTEFSESIFFLTKFFFKMIFKHEFLIATIHLFIHLTCGNIYHVALLHVYECFCIKMLVFEKEKKYLHDTEIPLPNNQCWNTGLYTYKILQMLIVWYWHLIPYLYQGILTKVRNAVHKNCKSKIVEHKNVWLLQTVHKRNGQHYKNIYKLKWFFFVLNKCFLFFSLVAFI